MKTYFLNLWDTLRSSYWFVPLLIATTAIALAVLLPMLDAVVEGSPFPMPKSLATTADTARAILTSIFGAMVAVTGTVFSITIVTLSLTSQQFGPRLLRRFMYDLPTQVTLGVFLSTGVYCLLILRVVEPHGHAAPAPHLSVLLAVVLAVQSLVLLIVFIHHVAMSIQAPCVVASVSQDLQDAIERLFPERMAESPGDANAEASAIGWRVQFGPGELVIRSSHEGYIQAVDESGLIALARDRGVVVGLRCRLGDFVAEGTPLADIWSANGEPGERPRGGDLSSPLNNTIIVGSRRTPRQDVECAIEELVEVAVRSLSPGINDPFTAVNCIDRLGAALGRLAEREQPASCHWDGEGELRLLTRPVAFSEALGTAYNRIRQYAHDSPLVLIRILESLTFIARQVRCDEDRDAVEAQVDALVRMSSAFTEEQDREALRSRREQIARLLGRPSAGVEHHPAT